MPIEINVAAFCVRPHSASFETFTLCKLPKKADNSGRSTDQAMQPASGIFSDSAVMTFIVPHRCKNHWIDSTCDSETLWERSCNNLKTPVFCWLLRLFNDKTYNLTVRNAFSLYQLLLKYMGSTKCIQELFHLHKYDWLAADEENNWVKLAKQRYSKMINWSLRCERKFTWHWSPAFFSANYLKSQLPIGGTFAAIFEHLISHERLDFSISNSDFSSYSESSVQGQPSGISVEQCAAVCVAFARSNKVSRREWK